jgi:hypothetical protein
MPSQIGQHSQNTNDYTGWREIMSVKFPDIVESISRSSAWPITTMIRLAEPGMTG